MQLWRRTRPWARVVALAVVAALVAGGAWWLWWRQPASAAADGQPTTRTVAASTTTMEKTVAASGTLSPTVRDEVAFAVSGTVTAVEVAVGDTVTKGQTLATVDTLQLEADLLDARATLAQAEARLADARDADDGTDAAQAQVDAAGAQVEVAQAQVDAAEEAMDDATLTAPAAGQVASVGLEVGDVVQGSTAGSGAGSGSAGGAGGSGATGTTAASSSSGGAQFVVVGTDAWQAEVTVGEADVADVQVGNQVEMTSDDLAETLYGVVSSVGLLSTSSSGVAAYPVTVEVTGDADGLHDGIAVDASIIYQRRTDVLTVPALAVSTAADGTSTVTTLAEDGTTQRTVTVGTGETSGSSVEITSGLAEGDQVVVPTFTPGAGRGGGSDTQQGGQLPDGFPQGGFPQGGFPGDGQAPAGPGGGNG